MCPTDPPASAVVVAGDGGSGAGDGGAGAGVSCSLGRLGTARGGAGEAGGSAQLAVGGISGGQDRIYSRANYPGEARRGTGRRDDESSGFS